MDVDETWLAFRQLPESDQREVEDFIKFLRAKRRRKPRRSMQTSILDDPFIGMWENRAEMADGATWVRQLRDREWSR